MSEHTADVPPLKTVIYCGVCTLPPEYCTFHPSFTRCKEWLRTTHPDLYSTLYGAEPIQKLVESTGELTIRDDVPNEADPNTERSSSRGGKAQIKDEAKKREKEGARRATARVTLRRDARNKRKSTTAVGGLDVFGLDLKKVAKRFAGRFACGATVAFNVSTQQEEVVIQGDFVDDLMDFIPQEYPEVDEDQIDIIEKP